MANKQEYIWKTFAMVGSCMAAIVLYGVSYSSGVYFPIFIDAFGETRAKTAWIGGLMMACSFSTGPISSLLVNRFGCRITVIIAGIVTATGLAISSQAHSLYMLFFTYGVMAGAGCGLLYVPTCVIIVEHFVKDRSTIFVGLVGGVGGLGSFIFPPIIGFLEGVYGWRGSLLVCAGISMHISLAGVMMHPGKSLTKLQIYQDDQMNDNVDESRNTETSYCETMDTDCLDKLSNSHSEIYCYETDESRLAIRINADDSEHSKKDIASSVISSNNDEQSENDINVESTMGVHRSLLSSLEANVYVSTHTNIFTEKTNWKRHLHLEHMLIFKKVSYSILCLQQILYALGASIIYVHLGAYAEFTRNISKMNSAMLFSTIGITLLVSKITWGFLLRIGALHIRVILLYTLTLSVTGLATFFLPLIASYIGLIAYAVIFGLGYCAFGGAHLILTIIEITGVEKFSIAYGFIVFFEGIGFIIGPPLAGWLYDTFQSYYASFILSASLIMISCLTMAIPLWCQANHVRNSTSIEKEVPVDGAPAKNHI